jgi:hypothetical protein
MVLDYCAFDPAQTLEAIVHCDSLGITTRMRPRLPEGLILEALAQTCGLHLRFRHDFAVTAYLVRLTNLLCTATMAGSGVIRATATAQTAAAISYALEVEDGPSCRILMGFHPAPAAPDTFFLDRFRCLSAPSSNA